MLYIVCTMSFIPSIFRIEGQNSGPIVKMSYHKKNFGKRTKMHRQNVLKPIDLRSCCL